MKIPLFRFLGLLTMALFCNFTLPNILGGGDDGGGGTDNGGSSDVNTQIVYNDGNGGGGVRIELGPDCEHTFRFSFKLTNLDQFTDTLDVEDSTAVFPLPSGYAPIFMEYYIGQDTTKIPITEFKYIGFVPTVNGTVTIFEAVREVTYSFSDLCQESTSGSIGLPVGINLLQGDGSPYPACSHWASDDIFSCSYFGPADSFGRKSLSDSEAIQKTGDTGTGNPCSPGSCATNAPISGEVLFRVICHENCDIDHGFGLPKTGTITTDEKATGLGLQVFPNPFTDELKVEWTGQSNSTVQLSLTDISGKLIQTWQVDGALQSQQLNNIQQLAPGIYFLALDHQGERSIHKLIKQ
ncbi:MAG: T9SS type A sorting domain-containing protein [Bacteroidota bacterium]